jgi:L-ascorbate metabolism protein UlaG (beta-lactamase superfamily)
VGFILGIGTVRIYHAGDSDEIPEMAGAKGVDVALLPVSGTYVMTAAEAVKACNVIQPKLAIPMHYGAIVGSPADAEAFRIAVKCRVEILAAEP